MHYDTGPRKAWEDLLGTLVEHRGAVVCSTRSDSRSLVSLVDLF